ncbi:GNAT family N-acetyltransferase [Cytobacillus sp. Sa5YUA1]|uniref:GNAT family N-acetyltransferase n=1 Tax=Cytobacillus stercorigallinarum TaxID=2762240 RepID=A0ABR8QLD6_9BACI|nr:GNAT family N-acetyltransferase [Cytobacillus stercorigallinarum]MBD7936332.1 GNAT family N-acetyltransferase [Cytobacillus stercorigallinarum]
MLIKPATSDDAAIITEIMQVAFREYNNPPASALIETTEEVRSALENGEQSLICYDQDIPVAMVRLKFTNKELYFYRLSVLPTYQRKGIAKLLLKELESYAGNYVVTQLVCKVRMTAPKNILLYQSVGYEIFDQVIVRKANGVEIPVVHMKKQIQLVKITG